MESIRTRLSLVEYGLPVDIARKICDVTRLSRAQANRLLVDAGVRVASKLRLGYNPIAVDERGVRAIDFAGLIRLAPALELEVAPKFLGLDDLNATWREDFFYLCMLSRHGQFLANERLDSSGGAPRDLSTLVARALVSMYEDRKRRPLRSYRRVRVRDFFIDGDPDPIDLILPSADGFDQEVIKFNRCNGWNSDILAAAKVLLPEVTDPCVCASLLRLIQDLSPQALPANRRRPIPSRQKIWSPVYQLSLDVLDGLGLNFRRGSAHAPGYLVSTWRIWEDLLAVSLRLSMGHEAVALQKGFRLGSRLRMNTVVHGDICVYPDCVVNYDGKYKMLWDAKYKGHVEKKNLRICEADIYESLAFAKASLCNSVVLAYPAYYDISASGLGSCTIFERIFVKDITIFGVQINIRKISQKNGLHLFVNNIKDFVNHNFSV